MSNRWSLVSCLLVSLLTVAAPAHAYLDPSTGGMILSAIIGMFATAALAVKTYWYKLKSLFRGKDPQPPKSEPADRRDPVSRPD
jgi:hypothetical protein